MPDLVGPIKASTLAKPIVKTLDEESSWRLSCSGTFFECFGELVVYSSILLCIACAVALIRRQIWHRRNGAGYSKVPLGGGRSVQDSPIPGVDIEEGQFEQVGQPLFAGGQRRVEQRYGATHGVMLSQALPDNDAGVGIDDYAALDVLRRLSHEMALKVKEVVPEISEVQAAVHVAKMSIQTAVNPAAHASPKSSPIMSQMSPPPARELEPLPDSVADCLQGGAEGDGGSSSASATWNRPRSMLHKVTQAWVNTIPGGSGCGEMPTGSDGRGAEGTLMVEELLEAFRVAITVCETFGPLMAPAVKNDQANNDKVRAAWQKLGRTPTLRGLLEAEIATKIHRPGGVLKDPSAAIALVWVRRSLAFQTALLEGLTVDRDAALSAVAGEAYKLHLEPHHNWMLKGTFKMGLGAMPKIDEFFQRLGVDSQPGLDREAIIDDMAELVQAQRRVMAIVGALLVELDLEKNI